MAKAKCVNLSGVKNDQNLDMNLQQDVDITDEIIDPDLFLRSFGISDDYCNPENDQAARIPDISGSGLSPKSRIGPQAELSSGFFRMERLTTNFAS